MGGVVLGERKINTGLKLVLELGPVLAFFVAFGRVKDKTFLIAGTEYSGFIVVTAAFVALIVVTTAILWMLTGKLSKMQLMTLVLVVVMGGLSVWLNDERFIKMKPTLLYLAFGGILGFGLLRGRSYLRLVMEEALPMAEAGWMILTRRVCGVFLALALTNEVIWRFFSTEIWVDFKTFGLPAVIFLFFMTQGKLIEAHALPEDKT
jgi:intracellular septation protein